jgi:hypothetical protein
MMIVDWSVNLGNLLQIASILGGGLVVLATMRSEARFSRQQLKDHHDRLHEIEDELKKQTDVLVTLARQDEQIKGMSTRIAALEIVLHSAKG